MTRATLFFTGITLGTAVGVAIAFGMLWRRPRAVIVRPPRWIDRLALVGSLFGVAAGLMVLLLGDTRVFAPWWEGFVAAFPGASRAAARSWFLVIGR